MTRDEVIARLLECESMLRARGVSHAALFGSTARGDSHPDSDVDILVDLDPDVVRTIYDYAGIKRIISEALAVQTDVVDRKCLRPELSRAVAADAIRAF